MGNSLRVWSWWALCSSVWLIATAASALLLGCAGGPRAQLRDERPKDAPEYASVCLDGAGEDAEGCWRAFMEAAERGDGWTAGQLLALAARPPEADAPSQLGWAVWLNPHIWLPESHPARRSADGMRVPAQRAEPDVVLSLWPGSAGRMNALGVVELQLDLPWGGASGARPWLPGAAAAQGAWAVITKRDGAEVALPVVPLLSRLTGFWPHPSEAVEAAVRLGQADAFFRQGALGDAEAAFLAAELWLKEGATSPHARAWLPLAQYGAWLSGSLRGSSTAGQTLERLISFESHSIAAPKEGAPEASEGPPPAYWAALAGLDAVGRDFSYQAPLRCADVDAALTAPSAFGAITAALLRDAREGHGEAICPELSLDSASVAVDASLYAAGRADRAILRSHRSLRSADGFVLRSGVVALAETLDNKLHRWQAAAVARIALSRATTDSPHARWREAPGVASPLCALVASDVRRALHTDREPGFPARVGESIARLLALNEACGSGIQALLADTNKTLSGTAGEKAPLALSLAAAAMYLPEFSPPWSEGHAEAALAAIADHVGATPEPSGLQPWTVAIRALAAVAPLAAGDWEIAASAVEREADLLEASLADVVGSLETDQLSTSHTEAAAALLALRLVDCVLSLAAPPAKFRRAIDSAARSAGLALEPFWARHGGAEAFNEAQTAWSALLLAVEALDPGRAPSLALLSDLELAAQQLARRAVVATEDGALTPLGRALLGAAEGACWAALALSSRWYGDAQMVTGAWRGAADAFAASHRAHPLPAVGGLTLVARAFEAGSAAASSEAALFAALGAVAPAHRRDRLSELSVSHLASPSAPADAKWLIEAAASLFAGIRGEGVPESGGGPLSLAEANSSLTLAALLQRAERLGLAIGDLPSASVWQGPSTLRCTLSAASSGVALHLTVAPGLRKPGFMLGLVPHTEPWLGLQCAGAEDPALAAESVLVAAAAHVVHASASSPESVEAGLAKMWEAWTSRRRLEPQHPLSAGRWRLLAWAVALARFGGHLLGSQQLDVALAEEAALLPSSALQLRHGHTPLLGADTEFSLLAPLVEAWALPVGPHGVLPAAAQAYSFRSGLVPSWSPIWAADVLWASFGYYAPADQLGSAVLPEDGPARHAVQAWRALRGLAGAPDISQTFQALQTAGWWSEACWLGVRATERALASKEREVAGAWLDRLEALPINAVGAGLRYEVDRLRISLLESTGGGPALESALAASFRRWWAHATAPVAWDMALSWVYASGPSAKSVELATAWQRDAIRRAGVGSSAHLTTSALLLAQLALSEPATSSSQALGDRVWAALAAAPPRSVEPTVEQALYLIRHLEGSKSDPKRQRRVASDYMRWLTDRGDPLSAP